MSKASALVEKLDTLLEGKIGDQLRRIDPKKILRVLVGHGHQVEDMDPMELRSYVELVLTGGTGTKESEVESIRKELGVK